ncbi:hypothetical protein OESDEN_15168, partial [Oesophagostomum dentatum]
MMCVNEDGKGILQSRIRIYPLVSGDFNAKVGKKQCYEEKVLGKHGYGYRNARGQDVVDFCEEFQLRVVASFFKVRKGRKWTWRSPDHSIFNCIDHTIACKHLVFKSMRTGEIEFATDHRLGVHSHLIAILRYVHDHAHLVVQIGETKIAVNIVRGVRQGDPLSPKLFTATLEHIFRRLNWTRYGLLINGCQLTNLRFADDVALIAKSEAELQDMIDELDQKSAEYGLKISDKKTK